jgi:hypothetical protein
VVGHGHLVQESKHQLGDRGLSGAHIDIDRDNVAGALFGGR